MSMKQNVLAGLFSMIVIGPALAAWTPPPPNAVAKLTQNRDEPARNPYYQQATCYTVTFGYCGVVFPAVPAGQRLVIEHVSALALMPAPNTISSTDIRAHNGIRAFMPVTVMPSVSGTYNYTINEQVLALFDVGEAPQVLAFVTSNTNFTFAVTVSGYTVTLP